MPTAYMLRFHRIYWEPIIVQTLENVLGERRSLYSNKMEKMGCPSQLCCWHGFFNVLYNHTYCQARVRYQEPERTKNVLRLIIDSMKSFCSGHLSQALKGGQDIIRQRETRETHQRSQQQRGNRQGQEGVQCAVYSAAAGERKGSGDLVFLKRESHPIYWGPGNPPRRSPIIVRQIMLLKS